MALKLLTRKDTLVKDESMGIAVRFGRFMPEHVAIIRGQMQTAETREAAAAKVGMFALREVISALTIKGETFDALTLSYILDTRDNDNVIFLMGLTSIVINELLVSDEVKKKLNSQPLPIGTANAAPDAPTASAETAVQTPTNSSKD